MKSFTFVCILLFAPVLAVAETKVAIVGGGLAGMTSLFRLQQAGHKDLSVTLFEQSDRLSGRIMSIPNPLGAGVLNAGATFIDSEGQESLLDLMKELGWDLDEELEPWARQQGWTEKSFLFPSLSPSLVNSEDLIASFFRDTSARKVLRMLSYHAELAEAESEAGEAFREKFAPITAADYLKILPRYAGVKEDRVQWLLKFIEIENQIILGKSLDSFTSLDLMSMANIDFESESLDLEGDHDEAWRVKGGTQRLADALAARLDANLIRLNTEVVSIGTPVHRRYPLTIRQPDGTVTHENFDVVIMAVPPPAVGNILKENKKIPEEVSTVLTSVTYGHVAKIFLHYKNRPWELNNHVGAVMINPAMNVYPDSNSTLQGEEILTALITGDEALRYNGLSQNEREIYAQSLVGRIEGFWPGGRYIGFNDIYWDAAYAGGDGGDIFWLKDYNLKPAGCVYFTGDYFSEHNNGYMAGAVESANRAVKHLFSKKSKCIRRHLTGADQRF